MVETSNLLEAPAKTGTHWQPHPDEAIAKALREIITGDSSQFRFLLNANEASDEDKENMIGAGGGEFDEHINGGSGRREHSAFALIVEELGLSDDIRARKLVEFINRVDSGSGSDPYDLSKVVQAIHRANPGSSEDGVNWCKDIIYSYWNDENYFRRPASECGAWFEKIGCVWLGSRFGKQNINDLTKRLFIDGMTLTFEQAVRRVGKTDNAAIKEMSRFFKNNCERMLQPFALARCLAAVNSKKGIRTAIRLAMEALDAKFENEEKFQEAKEEVGFNGETFQAGKFSVYRTTTQSKNVKDAILNSRKEISVIMQRNSYSGSVQIFSRAISGVRFEKLAAAIRLEELKLGGKPTDAFSSGELEDAGNTCGVQNWFFIVRRKEDGVWKGSYMLLSGSDSYPGIKPNIPWDQLKAIVIDVLGRQ